MNLEVYLTFNGECEEAFNFYKQALDAETLLINRYEGMPDMDVPDEWKQKVLHAILTLRNGIQIMGSDSMCGKPVSVDTNVSIALTFINREDEIKAFNALGEGGTVTIPLQEVFWESFFGTLTDKYGIQWMFNCFHKPENK